MAAAAIAAATASEATAVMLPTGLAALAVAEALATIATASAPPATPRLTRAPGQAALHWEDLSFAGGVWHAEPG